MIKPLETTQFGVPVSYSKPLSLNLWAKYKAGSEYKDKNGNILPDTDHPEIYAVLYESVLDGKGNELKLNGSNVQTAPNIVSIAIMNENTANSLIVNDIDADEYRFIEIPFIYRQSFDPQKQAAGKYYFTVVFSSSAKGDLFEGAVGSALCIDEVEIVTE
jgi:hypothetical protein